jgi:hypothetical protein
LLIYFDESYDGQHQYLLLGALFNPHPKYLHSELGRIKRSKGFVTASGSLKELKYSRIDSRSIDVYKESIDAFMKSTSWFRCIVVEEALMDLNRFGSRNESDNIKKARAYKKFAELLLASNLSNVKNAVLLTDEMQRCRGDRFIEVMKDAFCIPEQNRSLGCKTAVLSEILTVESHLEQYQVIQLCDVLLGCVLNGLKPTSRVAKNEVRIYLANQLGVSGFTREDWKHISKRNMETILPKFNVWHWTPSAK